MDLFLNDEAPERLRIRYSPILWEPQSGAGERFVALVAVVPIGEWPKAGRCVPRAYISMRRTALSVLAGTAKASHAACMLEETRDFLSEQLEHGVDLSGLQMPFDGFALGEERIAQGVDFSQALNVAAARASILCDDLTAWDSEDQDAIGSVSTRRFLVQLRSQFSRTDPSRKERFRRKLDVKNGPSILVDYAFERWVAQVASLPTSAHQAAISKQEAESKLLRLQAIRDEFAENRVQTRLVVNANSNRLKGDQIELKGVRAESLEALRYFASRSDTEVLLAQSIDDGIEIFESMS